MLACLLTYLLTHSLTHAKLTYLHQVVTKTDRQEEELKGYAARGGIG